MKKYTLTLSAVLGFLSAFADIYMAGDSTMCNYPNRAYPQQGWGQALGRYMKNPDQLHNWAIGGRSAKSYKAEGRWQKLVDALKPGDFVIVAFGHNDANKRKTERYSSPADYKELMRGFAADVKAKDATLVFATSIPHSGGISKDAEGKTHVRGSAAGIGPYVTATCELGKELELEVLDLNAYACKGFEEMGAEKAYKLYMRIAPGEYAAYPNGKGDGCHTRDTGADFFARGAVQMCFDRKLPIAALFKEPKDVVFTPIGFDGPGKSAKPLKDDFSKDEIAYAGSAESAMPKYLRLDRDFTPTNAVAVASPFAGKKIAFLGDSYVQNHRRPIPEAWHYRLAEKFGMHYYNFGRNGNTLILGRKGWGEPMCRRYREIPADVDYLVVVAGHNDADNIARLGGKHTIPDPTPEQKTEQQERLATFKEGLRKFIADVKVDYPRATLVFVTPWNVNRSFFPEVIAAIKEEATAAGVPCYDAATLSGIDPNSADFRKKYFQGPNDTAHLTYDGHGLMLEKMEAFFKALPPPTALPSSAPALGWSKPLEIGNYDVTIRLGDKDKPTVNYIKFMGRRLAGDCIETKAGESKDFTFTARVPGPYTKKDDGSNRELTLALFTDGKEVACPEPKIVRNDAAPTIWLCGDSTVTDQKSEPWGSWGQILPAFVKPGWACVNFARSGRAMATFEGEGRLRRILAGMNPGDWVIVQFGHNDQKRKGEEPENGYTRRYGEWLAKFREKEAHLVVVSPCERRRFDEKTGAHQGKTLEGYANAARAFAEKNALPFIDLNDITWRMHDKLGAKATRPLHVNNRGKLDNTHHTVYGAYVNARIIASRLAKIDGIGAAIRDEDREYDAMNPTDPKIPASGKTDWKKPEGN